MVKKLAIFGISGRTGLEIARVAISRGWEISGLVRPGTSLHSDIAATHIVHGEFSNAQAVVQAIEGCSAVCCAIGPRPPFTEVFCTRATNAIVSAMRIAGCRRLICQTGAMIGASSNRSMLMNIMATSFVRREPEAALDRADQERVVIESGLDWTIVKPPRLTNGEPHGVYEAGSSLRIGLLSKISRTDLAGFTLDIVEQNKFVKQRVYVKS